MTRLSWNSNRPRGSASQFVSKASSSDQASTPLASLLATNAAAPERPRSEARAAAAPDLAPDEPRASTRATAVVTSLAAICGAWLAVCFLGRVALFAWQYERLHDIAFGERLLAFVHGLRMDLIGMGYLLIVPALVLTLAPASLRRGVATGLRVYVLGVMLVLAFLEVATFPFFAEYDVRPNILFVAYLEYPREVAEMLWKDQKAGLAAQAVMLASLAWLALKRRWFARFESVLAVPWTRRALLFLPVALVVFGAIRSSFGHRPANLSDAAYSSNRVAGEIAKNTAYSIAYEAYRGRKDGKRLSKQYGEIALDEAYRRAERMLATPHDPEAPFRRTVAPAVATERPRNLVILVQESMGAQFVGHLGDTRKLTPHIDALAKESLAFTQLYSNGTRSIRGLSALSAGFLPLVGDGVLKRPKSQSGFFSIASLLEPLGYQTSFIYGGEARFDNMRGWYLGNGFDRVIEEKDYANPAFRSTWGVSDEDLLDKALETYRAQHASGRPFASVVFTSSNHSPFELPDGRIEWVEGVPRGSVENAIRYADHAVGRFFDAVRDEPFYSDTVFVVAADHNVRVWGDEAVPVYGFHIPGLVHGVGIEAREFGEISTQPDMLATALGFLGVELSYPILGNSIFLPQREHFALMQFNDTYGFRRGDHVAVLRPGLAPQTFLYRNRTLEPVASDRELELDGLALIHVTEDLYERRLYR